MLDSRLSRHGLIPRSFFLAGATLASCVIALTTGCASGGFKLTRQYASFVNSKNIIIRILLYIFTGIVFAVTLLVDMVINNTIDFWSGTVSAGSYNFKKGDKTYVAKHEFFPGTQLKRSTIEIHNLEGLLLQTVRIEETPKHEIELYVDNKLRTRVTNINEIPVATLYDTKGLVVKNEFVFANVNVAANH